jgi:hypothetical protein
MKTKVVVVAIGGMVALLLLLRYFALSRTGLPVGWMLYLGLPVTAAGVLFALRLVDLGAGWGTSIDDVRSDSGVPSRPETEPAGRATDQSPAQPPLRRIFQRTKPR